MIFTCKVIFLLFSIFASKCHSLCEVKPEQIHLSLGANPSEMVVTWTTLCPTKSTEVMYGEIELIDLARGSVKKFVDGGALKREIYIHRVFLKNLKPAKTYKYSCGNNNIWSKVYEFTTIKSGNDWSPRIVLIGDLGVENGRSLPFLIEDVKNKFYDILLHDGDIAYDMDSNNARVGDEYMRRIEPIAANLPYMVCPGNHEYKYNFSNYDNRFSMINQADGTISNHFYSFDICPAHIISFSTEFYYFTKFGTGQLLTQYQWLENDLIEANKPKNRAERPWIITMGHRPMMCSNENGDDCTKKESRVRKRMPLTREYALEDLFFKYGVDISLWGHEHSFERLWPMYNMKVYNGSLEQPYKNPKAPIHIISGYAGNHEKFNKFGNSQPEWSAFRANDYGYTRMTLLNKTHIYIEQFSVEKNQSFDKIFISKKITDLLNHKLN